MKSEYGTGEVILLQTLDYFRQKTVELEGATYRANELNEVYEALHKDYVQKCAEYNALNKTYEAFNADFDKMCVERDAAVAEATYLRENYKELEKEYNELEKDYNDLRKKAKELQTKNDQHVREWSMQHVEKQAAERLATDMESNYQNLLNDYNELYEENEKLKETIKLFKANQNVLVEENENLKGLLHAETKLDESLDKYMESWEKAGY